MAKKNFKNDIQGADKLFSANDTNNIMETEKISDDTPAPVDDDNINANTKVNILSNILINIKEEPKGKNYTFYLSNEVATAITSTAKKNKISSSKLVDTILKQVLLEN
jgi:hypothetical protein